MEMTQCQGKRALRRAMKMKGGKRSNPRSIEDIVFNKIPPVESAFRKSKLYVDGVHDVLYPLLPRDYPLNTTVATILSTQTMADSPMLSVDHRLVGDEFEKYCTLFPPPHYPSKNPKHPYWKEFRRVVDFQFARERDEDPSKLNRWPDLWKGYSLDDIAQAVKDEFPAYHQAKVLEMYLQQGLLKIDCNVMQCRSLLDAVGTQFTVAAINTWTISAVSPITFLCKWSYGLNRPEEMASVIAKGKYGEVDGVPHDLVRAIKAMALRNAFDFTAYKDQGCPTHPALPAMHSAGSTLSTWLPVVAELTAKQYCEVLRVDLGVSLARTVAGLHYYQDNYAGLNMGMKIIQDRLPGYLKVTYGGDAQRAREKLDILHFDWEDFDPERCTIAGVPVSARLEQLY